LVRPWWRAVEIWLWRKVMRFCEPKISSLDSLSKDALLLFPLSYFIFILACSLFNSRVLILRTWSKSKSWSWARLKPISFCNGFCCRRRWTMFPGIPRPSCLLRSGRLPLLLLHRWFDLRNLSSSRRLLSCS